MKVSCSIIIAMAVEESYKWKVIELRVKKKEKKNNTGNCKALYVLHKHNKS